MTMLDRIRQLPACRFGNFLGWHTMTYRDETAWYGDFQDLDKDKTLPEDYVVPELMRGGDYAGTTIERANHRAFLKLYGHLPGVHNVAGGFGMFATALSIKWLLDNPELAECILDTLEALNEYPVIDDEELSEYESELAREGWDTWARHDYCVGLKKKFGNIEVTDDDAYELFNRIATRIGIDWEADGNDMSIDVDKVVNATSVDDFCTTTTR